MPKRWRWCASSREASDVRVQLPREAAQAAQHQSLVPSVGRASIQDFRWHDLRPAGRRGTCRTARRCSRCRSWAVGRVRRWCVVMRTLRPITWRPTRSALAPYVPSRSQTLAQIRHRGESELGVAISQSHVGPGAGSRNRTSVREPRQCLFSNSHVSKTPPNIPPPLRSDRASRVLHAVKGFSLTKRVIAQPAGDDAG
jgi:hypothetical protein